MSKILFLSVKSGRICRPRNNFVLLATSWKIWKIQLILKIILAVAAYILPIQGVPYQRNLAQNRPRYVVVEGWGVKSAQPGGLNCSIPHYSFVPLNHTLAGRWYLVLTGPAMACPQANWRARESNAVSFNVTARVYKTLQLFTSPSTHLSEIRKPLSYFVNIFPRETQAS
jgi:hypothetical protein